MLKSIGWLNFVPQFCTHWNILKDHFYSLCVIFMNILYSPWWCSQVKHCLIDPLTSFLYYSFNSLNMKLTIISYGILSCNQFCIFLRFSLPLCRQEPPTTHSISPLMINHKGLYYVLLAVSHSVLTLFLRLFCYRFSYRLVNWF